MLPVEIIVMIIATGRVISMNNFVPCNMMLLNANANANSMNAVFLVNLITTHHNIAENANAARRTAIMYIGGADTVELICEDALVTNTNPNAMDSKIHAMILMFIFILCFIVPPLRMYDIAAKIFCFVVCDVLLRGDAGFQKVCDNK